MLEAEMARVVLAARALDRVVLRVHAPDAWFVKRGATPSVLSDVLTRRAFAHARRIGKQLLLDTTDDGPTLGLHLGMSGRVIVDDLEAGDPLIYASNRDELTWRRFGVEFVDGGSMWLRDPRRLGAVELDPDESRWGPDASRITAAAFVSLLASSRAPVKAVMMDQARVAGLGNLLGDEILWRVGIAPARPANSIAAEDARAMHRTLRSTLKTLGRRGGSHTGDHVAARREGSACPRDGMPMQRGKVGGRTTYSCSLHQR